MRLWKDHGISSFVAASPSQGVPCSYYLIKEAIHEQHPRLIVMDAYYLVHNIYARSKERLHEVVDPMPLTSKVRYEMIRDIVPNVKGEENEYSFYFTLGLYHSRWEVLKRSDFYPEYQFLKGVVLDEQNDTVKIKSMPETKTKIPKIPRKYLKKIISICNANGVKLLLVSIPYDHRNIGRHMKIYRHIEDQAQRGKFDYINFFRSQNGIEWDYNRDFKEDYHLNALGAVKLTDYMSSYIDEHYDIPDHRGEKEYGSWDVDYEQYKIYEKSIIHNTLMNCEK